MNTRHSSHLLLPLAFALLLSACRQPKREAQLAKVARIRAELYPLATAIDAYRVAHGQLPQSLEQLTTPTPFIAALPRDSFASDRPLHYLVDPPLFRIWSVGPDVRNDSGKIHYDPTNGSLSRGDIVYHSPAHEGGPLPLEDMSPFPPTIPSSDSPPNITTRPRNIPTH